MIRVQNNYIFHYWIKLLIYSMNFQTLNKLLGDMTRNRLMWFLTTVWRTDSLNIQCFYCLKIMSSLSDVTNCLVWHKLYVWSDLLWFSTFYFIQTFVSIDSNDWLNFWNSSESFEYSITRNDSIETISRQINLVIKRV